MEIDRTNFSICLKQITEFLNNVEFASFDLLTTGSFKCENFSIFDNSIERYNKLFQQERNIQIVKIGLTLFGYENNKHVIKSYNISLFPQTFRGQCDNQFDISIQLLEKLKNKNFDFNAWISKGVPYFTSDQQQMISDDKSFNVIDFYLENPYKQQQQNLCVILKNKWEKIVHWIESGQENEFLDVICRGNDDKRKVLQKINHDYEHLMDNIFVKEVSIEEKMILRFQKCSKIKKKMLQKKAQKDLQNVIDIHIGFSSLWNILKKHLIKKNRAFVGQNLLENFYILINSFEKKLKEKNEYQNFKKFIKQKMFKKIYDIKLLAIKNNLIDQNFQQLYKKIISSQEHQFPQFEYKKDQNSPAFISYQLGCIFIALKKLGHFSMLNCLGLLNNNFYAMKLESQGSDKILQQSIYKLEPLQIRNNKEEFIKEVNKIFIELQNEKRIQHYTLLQDKNQIFVRLKFKLFVLKKIKNAFKDHATMKSLEHVFKDSSSYKLLQLN